MFPLRRLHRRGQNHLVQIYYLVLPPGSEEDGCWQHMRRLLRNNTAVVNSREKAEELDVHRVQELGDSGSQSLHSQDHRNSRLIKTQFPGKGGTEANKAQQAEPCTMEIEEEGQGNDKFSSSSSFPELAQQMNDGEKHEGTITIFSPPLSSYGEGEGGSAGEQTLEKEEDEQRTQMAQDRGPEEELLELTQVEGQDEEEHLDMTQVCVYFCSPAFLRSFSQSSDSFNASLSHVGVGGSRRRASRRFCKMSSHSSIIVFL